MGETKRMRVFAGPNGSGKTTIFRKILEENKIKLGIYVNSDDLEQQLSGTKKLDFSDFHLLIENKHLQAFFQFSQFSPVKRSEPDLWKKLVVVNNIIQIDTSVDSYLAADLAEYIRQQLLQSGHSFTYETVMSHPGKVDFMKQAQSQGYRVYLYYIATEDPDINISRVGVRVNQLGHPVDPEVVRSRYYKSLRNLKAAVKSSNRAYVFDNSGIQASFIAEITDGIYVSLNDAASMPTWVANYLLK